MRHFLRAFTFLAKIFESVQGIAAWCPTMNYKIKMHQRFPGIVLGGYNTTKRLARYWKSAVPE